MHTLQLKSYEEIADYYDGVARRMNEYEPSVAMKRAATRFSVSVMNNFLESRAPDGTPWAPLKYRIGMPLILTGWLMRSATETMENATYDSAKKELVATMLEPFYGIFHQFGTKRGLRARPFYGFRSEDIDWMMMDIADDFLRFSLGGEEFMIGGKP